MLEILFESLVEKIDSEQMKGVVIGAAFECDFAAKDRVADRDLVRAPASHHFGPAIHHRCVDQDRVVTAACVDLAFLQLAT